MRFYTRTGPNTSVSYGPFFLICFWIGYLPFLIIGLMFSAALILAALTLAVIIGLVLAANGIIYHKITGKDARVPVPGSEHGSEIEYWMEEKGWIRLPKRIQRLAPMTPTQITSSLYGDAGLRKKEISPKP